MIFQAQNQHFPISSFRASSGSDGARMAACPGQGLRESRDRLGMDVSEIGRWGISSWHDRERENAMGLRRDGKAVEITQEPANQDAQPHEGPVPPADIRRLRVA